MYIKIFHIKNTDDCSITSVREFPIINYDRVLRQLIFFTEEGGIYRSLRWNLGSLWHFLQRPVYFTAYGAM
jgi:hypothetical protein